jgi:hypothetical protein
MNEMRLRARSRDRTIWMFNEVTEAILGVVRPRDGGIGGSARLADAAQKLDTRNAEHLRRRERSPAF